MYWYAGIGNAPLKAEETGEVEVADRLVKAGPSPPPPLRAVCFLCYLQRICRGLRSWGGWPARCHTNVANLAAVGGWRGDSSRRSRYLRRNRRRRAPML